MTTIAPDIASRIGTARSLATDASCAEVVSAWQRQGIDAILLKGPSTAEWLYRDEPRAYQDADLLVAPECLGAARAVLRALGFAPDRSGSEHGHAWMRRSDRAVIDLHRTIWGSTQSPERVWSELQGWIEPYRIGSVTTNVLMLPARALHVALHAAQHRDVAVRQADLRRALERTTVAQWRQAEQLAERIRALPMMAMGLQLVPAGRDLLRELPLAQAGLLAEVADAPLAVGFARLNAARGVGGKAAVLAAAILAPAPQAMHGSRAAALPARLRRLAWLLRGLPRTLWSMRRARASGTIPN